MKTSGTGYGNQLLETLEEALLTTDDDLVVRSILSDAARQLLRAAPGAPAPQGRPLERVFATIIAPRALQHLLRDIRGYLSEPCVEGRVARGVEGAASAAMRSAGLTRYFDIHYRCIEEAAGRELLFSIRDVTERLRLGRALEEARNSHELAVAALRGDPERLGATLLDLTTCVSLIQSLMRLPAREPDAFRSKVTRILDEVRTVHGLANRFQLLPIVRQCERLESELEMLHASEAPSGDEFLSFSVELDGLFSYITTTSQLVEQRSVPLAASPPNAVATPRVPEEGARWTEECVRSLKDVIESVRDPARRGTRLTVRGLSLIPEGYRRNVSHMLYQLVRNSVQHGIEPEGERRARHKPPAGRISVECQRMGSESVEITVRDDGRGFDVDLIGRLAVERGLISREELEKTDSRKILGLIFRPGFTAHPGPNTSGRGLGTVFLRELVTRMNGNISVATKAHRYTQFRILLPLPDACGPRAESQHVA